MYGESHDTDLRLSLQLLSVLQYARCLSSNSPFTFSQVKTGSMGRERTYSVFVCCAGGYAADPQTHHL